jgi:hypothetical protein
LCHGSRRTIGAAATAVAPLALLHPISILVRPVPGDLLQPAREEPLAFGLTATVVEQQPSTCGGPPRPEAAWRWSPQ